MALRPSCRQIRAHSSFVFGWLTLFPFLPKVIEKNGWGAVSNLISQKREMYWFDTPCSLFNIKLGAYSAIFCNEQPKSVIIVMIHLWQKRPPHLVTQHNNLYVKRASHNGGESACMVALSLSRRGCCKRELSEWCRHFLAHRTNQGGVDSH